MHRTASIDDLRWELALSLSESKTSENELKSIFDKYMRNIPRDIPQPGGQLIQILRMGFVFEHSEKVDRIISEILLNKFLYKFSADDVHKMLREVGDEKHIEEHFNDGKLKDLKSMFNDERHAVFEILRKKITELSQSEKWEEELYKRLKK